MYKHSIPYKMLYKCYMYIIIIATYKGAMQGMCVFIKLNPRPVLCYTFFNSPKSELITQHNYYANETPITAKALTS